MRSYVPGIPKLHQGRIPACEMTAVSYIDVGMVCSTASFEEHNLMAWNNFLSVEVAGLPYLPVWFKNQEGVKCSSLHLFFY